MKRIIDFTKYKIRVCLTVHNCENCLSVIHPGEQYHDGGYGRRVHVKCSSIPCTCDFCLLARKTKKK